MPLSARQIDAVSDAVSQAESGTGRNQSTPPKITMPMSKNKRNMAEANAEKCVSPTEPLIQYRHS